MEGSNLFKTESLAKLVNIRTTKVDPYQSPRQSPKEERLLSKSYNFGEEQDKSINQDDTSLTRKPRQERRSRITRLKQKQDQTPDKVDLSQPRVVEKPSLELKSIEYIDVGLLTPL